MAKRNKGLLLLAGMGAAILISRKNRRPSSTKRASAESEEALWLKPLDLGGPEGVRAPTSSRPRSIIDAPIFPSIAELLQRNTDADGHAQLGMLYQIKAGDTPIGVASEALFGSRAPMVDPFMKRAAQDLVIRIMCSPWNQALYGVDFDDSLMDSIQMDEYFAKRSISFDPIYQDNYQRMLSGLQPTAEDGNYHAFIWIPMINLEIFDLEGVVTTKGMNHQDTEFGIGGSMIDPPPEIISIGFAKISSLEVGCSLPEGDFRRIITA